MAYKYRVGDILVRKLRAGYHPFMRHYIVTDVRPYRGYTLSYLNSITGLRQEIHVPTAQGYTKMELKWKS